MSRPASTPSSAPVPDAAQWDDDVFRAAVTSLCEDDDCGCPRCGDSRRYPLQDGRRRCGGCGYTFHMLTRRWLNRGGLSLPGWRCLLQCFAEGEPVSCAAQRLDIKYDTALKAYATTRSAVLATLLQEASSATESAAGSSRRRAAGPATLFTHRGELRRFCPNLRDEGPQTLCEGCRATVFRLDLLTRAVRPGGETPTSTTPPVLEDSAPSRYGLSLLASVKAREVLAWPLPKKQWRCFIHTDSFQGAQALVFSCCRLGRELFADRFTQAPLTLDSASDLKPFVDAHLASHKAINPEFHPLYLAEAIFRYNNRGIPLFPPVLACLCRRIPHASSPS